MFWPFFFFTVPPLCVKDHVTLSITPVAGLASVMMPTAGKGRWQTSLQYLVWTIPQEVHQVNINFLLCTSCAIIFLMINIKRCSNISNDTVSTPQDHKPMTTTCLFCLFVCLIQDMSCIQMTHKVGSGMTLNWNILLIGWQLWVARSGNKNLYIYMIYHWPVSDLNFSYTLW